MKKKEEMKLKRKARKNFLYGKFASVFLITLLFGLFIIWAFFSFWTDILKPVSFAPTSSPPTSGSPVPSETSFHCFYKETDCGNQENDNPNTLSGITGRDTMPIPMPTIIDPPYAGTEGACGFTPEEGGALFYTDKLPFFDDECPIDMKILMFDTCKFDPAEIAKCPYCKEKYVEETYYMPFNSPCDDLGPFHDYLPHSCPYDDEIIGEQGFAPQKHWVKCTDFCAFHSGKNYGACFSFPFDFGTGQIVNVGECRCDDKAKAKNTDNVIGIKLGPQNQKVFVGDPRVAGCSMKWIGSESCSNTPSDVKIDSCSSGVQLIEYSYFIKNGECLDVGMNDAPEQTAIDCNEYCQKNLGAKRGVCSSTYVICGATDTSGTGGKCTCFSS